MKQVISIFLIVFIAACGTPDNKAKLAKLRAEKTKIEAQIKELESQVSDSTETGKVKNVSIALIATEKFDHFIEIQGKLDGEENVGATSLVPGVVKAIYVKAGESVKKGQVLGELDSEALKLGIKELEAALVFTTDLYNRQKALWEQKVGSEVQYLQAKNAKEGLENKLTTLREQIEMYKIVSPINGTVEDIAVKVGQASGPGPMAAFKIVNFSKVKVVADVSETYASRIAKGNRVTLFFPDLNHEVSSVVDFASKFINPINRTFVTEVRFSPESNIQYKANMIVVTKINDYHKEKAICLSLNYVQSDQTGEYVMLEENGKAMKHRVKTGQSYNGKIEILEGLAEGDRLIVAGHQDLEEGQLVNVTKN